LSTSKNHQTHDHLDLPVENISFSTTQAAPSSCSPPLPWKNSNNNNNYYQSSTNHPPSLSFDDDDDDSSMTSTATCTTTVTVMSTATDSSLYSLPPIPDDRPLTPLEQEFRNMLQHFANYTTRDIQSLRDPRTRAIFAGVAASAYDPAVYRAFEVLFEDVYPLRLAGRMVYTNLQHLMETSQCERKKEVQCIVERTGLTERDVEEARLAFVSLAAQMNGDAFLTLDQLKQTELVCIAEDILGFEHADAFFERLVATTTSCTSRTTTSSSQKQQNSNNKNKNQNKLTFVEVMLGLQSCAEEMCALDRCNPAAVMQSIMVDLKEHPPAFVATLDDKRQKFSDRYDEMVTTFKQWEHLLPQQQPSHKPGRILDVVRGCFVGAANPKVVEALRIVYVDYSALRLAGDIIFKLVSSVMKKRERQQQQQQQQQQQKPS